MSCAYTEDQLVEQPAKRLFAELNWSVAQPHPYPKPLPGGEGFWKMVSRYRLRIRRIRRAAPSSQPSRPVGEKVSGGRLRGNRVVVNTPFVFA